MHFESVSPLMSHTRPHVSYTGTHCPTCTCNSATATIFGEHEGSAKTVADLDVLILQLQRRRNSLLPISQLPAEVLSDIFILHRDDLSDASWIFVSYVSYTWRTVALAHPRLWSTVNVRHGRLAHEMLLRSGGTPLHIVRLAIAREMMASPRELDAERGVAAAVLQSTVVAIDLFIGSQDAIGTVFPLALVPRDKLRSISLHFPRSIHRYHTVQDFMKLFEVAYPALESLCMDGYPFMIRSLRTLPVAPSLRTLRLSSLEGKKTIQSLADFLSAFKLLPLLEVLSLRGIELTPGHNEDTDTLPSIDLSHLTDLVLHVDLKGCIAFYAHIRFPTSCSVELKLTTNLVSDISVWTARAATLALSVLGAQVPEATGSRALRLVPSRMSLRILTHHTSPKRRIELLDMDDTFYPSLCYRVGPVLPAEHLIVDRPFTSYTWWPQACTSPAIQTLHIIASDRHNPLGVFLGVFTGLEDRDTRVAPRMARLYFEGVEFKASLLEGEHGYLSLLGALKLRAHRGVFDALELTRCRGVSRSMIDQWTALSEETFQIRWDGWTS